MCTFRPFFVSWAILLFAETARAVAAVCEEKGTRGSVFAVVVDFFVVEISDWILFSFLNARVKYICPWLAFAWIFLDFSPWFCTLVFFLRPLILTTECWILHFYFLWRSCWGPNVCRGMSESLIFVFVYRTDRRHFLIGHFFFFFFANLLIGRTLLDCCSRSKPGDYVLSWCCQCAESEKARASELVGLCKSCKDYGCREEVCGISRRRQVYLSKLALLCKSCKYFPLRALPSLRKLLLSSLPFLFVVNVISRHQ